MTEEKTMILPLSFQEITCENCGQTFILLGTDKDGSRLMKLEHYFVLIVAIERRSSNERKKN